MKPDHAHAGQDFPDAGGLYLLFCILASPQKIAVGQLGTFEFQAGSYAYIGSGRGPGGLTARLNRHIRRSASKQKHWHIDHFLARAVPRTVGWSTEPQLSECKWGQSLAGVGRRWPPRFGASDCRCPGHLIQFDDQITIQDISTSIPGKLRIEQLRPNG